MSKWRTWRNVTFCTTCTHMATAWRRGCHNKSNLAFAKPVFASGACAAYLCKKYIIHVASVHHQYFCKIISNVCLWFLCLPFQGTWSVLICPVHAVCHHVPQNYHEVPWVCTWVHPAHNYEGMHWLEGYRVRETPHINAQAVRSILTPAVSLWTPCSYSIHPDCL